MTDEEVRHMNVLLEDIKQQVKLVLEGHQVLDRKIDRLEQKIENTRTEFKADIAGVARRIDRVDQKVDRVEGEVQSLRGILAKLTELMDDHDRWLREHEVRLKTIESPR